MGGSESWLPIVMYFQGPFVPYTLSIAVISLLRSTTRELQPSFSYSLSLCILEHVIIRSHNWGECVHGPFKMVVLAVIEDAVFKLVVYKELAIWTYLSHSLRQPYCVWLQG